jgi:membrane protein
VTGPFEGNLAQRSSCLRLSGLRRFYLSTRVPEMAGVRTMGFRGFLRLLKQAATDWLEDRGPRLGASIAFYTIFSLSPLIIIVVAVVGLAFGEEAARGQIYAQMHDLVGPQGAEAIESTVQSAADEATGTLASLVAIAALIIGATVVFAELQDALNKVWKVTTKKSSGLLGLLRTRLLSFALVLGIGFLLLVSLLLSAGLAAFLKFMADFAPGMALVSHALNFFIPFLIIMALFAMIFRFLPDTDVAWSDVWLGAAITSLLFSIGKTLVGLYLGQSTVASAYGAAGSLVVILIWVYYSAQILFFGAEFTHAYAKTYGSHASVISAPATPGSSRMDSQTAKGSPGLAGDSGPRVRVSDLVLATALAGAIALASHRLRARPTQKEARHF